MTDTRGVALIREDLIVKGEIQNCREIDVYGYVEGKITAQTLRVHPGGRVFGTIKAENAEIQGTVQGTVTVKQLISIASTGSVSGSVRYGRLALAQGGELSALLRNVPPEVGGDLEVAVRRGRAVEITTADLTAMDPDDTAQSLIYTVSNAMRGIVVHNSAPTMPVATFSQADLEAGTVFFVHDGSESPTASFDVVVADGQGATSGAARTVGIAVVAR